MAHLPRLIPALMVKTLAYLLLTDESIIKCFNNSTGKSMRNRRASLSPEEKSRKEKRGKDFFLFKSA